MITIQYDVQNDKEFITYVKGDPMDEENCEVKCFTNMDNADNLTSDGSHTFNDLYYHRTILFSVIVRDYSFLAWKSKKHNDGTMYDNYFIVGIDTPQGQATYHCELKYWDLFDCEVLKKAPKWDGHSPQDAINRLSKLNREDAVKYYCEKKKEDYRASRSKNGK